jgi:hypothetical protein
MLVLVVALLAAMFIVGNITAATTVTPTPFIPPTLSLTVTPVPTHVTTTPTTSKTHTPRTAATKTAIAKAAKPTPTK